MIAKFLHRAIGTLGNSAGAMDVLNFSAAVPSAGALDTSERIAKMVVCALT